jgi:hypothetical protein
MNPGAWIATIGAPKGHRVRFLYQNGERPGQWDESVATRTIECECGWRLTYAGHSRKEAFIAHARHAHNQTRDELVASANAATIGARDAHVVDHFRAERDLLVDMNARPDDDDANRLDGLPHPSELEP